MALRSVVVYLNRSTGEARKINNKNNIKNPMASAQGPGPHLILGGGEGRGAGVRSFSLAIIKDTPYVDETWGNLYLQAWTS